MRAFLLFTILLTTAALSAQTYGFLKWTVADGLPNPETTALAQDDQGFVWVGTNGGGVARFDGEAFTTYSTAEGLRDNFVTNIVVQDGIVFVRTRLGVARYSGQDDVFQGADAGAIPVEKARNNLRHFPASDPGIPRLTDALQLLPRSWLAATVNGLYLTSPDGTIIERYTAPNDLPDNYVNALLTDRQGRTWIATRGGLVRMIPSGLRRFAPGTGGPAGRKISAIHATPAGNLWLGLGPDGIQLLDSSGFNRPAIDDPTRGVMITAITQTADGRTYFATDGRGITVIDDTLAVGLLTTRSGLPDDRLLGVVAADSGGVWAVSFDQGIGRVRFQDTTFSVRTFGADEGVPLTNFTTAVATAEKDGLFLGSNLGNVYRWQPDTDTRVFGPANGLPSAPITAMALRRKTQLWVAVAGSGLFYTDLRMDTVRFAPLPSRFGAMPTNIHQILAPNRLAEIWIGDDRGLHQIYLNGDGRPDWQRRYGRSEGFLNAATTPGATAATSRYFWFGTTNGLVRNTYGRSATYLPPPPTTITGINLFYAPLSPDDFTVTAGLPELDADNNHLNFRFRAVDLTYPDRIRYQWRLRPYEREWSPASTETAVRYAGLNAGRYNFEARATTNGGNTWGEPAEFTFVIATPFWRQTWVWGLLALIGATILVGGAYAFYRRIQAGETRKRQRLEAQNQLLALEQKALQLQMNPHFIFNALNGVRGLINGKNDAEARAQIGRFAKLMRGILINSRRETIPLSEEINTLTDYLEMERFCQPFDFTFIITPPADADPEEISMPSMLLQPFLENAVLHGFGSLKDRVGHISVVFSLRGRGMQCLVTDNGVGRAVAAQRKAGRPAGHKSVALDVTRERLKALKGRMEVRDLTGTEGEGLGTEIELYFPVETW